MFRSSCTSFNQFRKRFLIINQSECSLDLTASIIKIVDLCLFIQYFSDYNNEHIMPLITLRIK